MALIVEYHIVADMYPVGETTIEAGMNVTLIAGLCVPTTANTSIAIGLAGDSRLSAEGRTTAYSDQVRIGAGGTTRYTANRVSDFYNETLASDKITVYHGGGKFWISADLINSDSSVSSTIGTTSWLEVGTPAGNWKMNAGAAVNEFIAAAVGPSQPYSSGVPGTDTTDGSITLGNYVPIVLRI